MPVTGEIPAGLPSLEGPALRLRDVEGIFPLAAGCLLLAYVESVSAARTFAAKHGYALDPRQEFLGLGAANLAAALGHGYPVAGGLSQSAVNDKAGARTPLALVFASITLALCLLFLTGFLENLPKAVLAAVVLTAILGLFDFRALIPCGASAGWTSTPPRSRSAPCCCSASCTASCSPRLPRSLLLLINASQPHVAFLGRIPGTNIYSDVGRHPENEPLPGVIAFRPEASLHLHQCRRCAGFRDLPTFGAAEPANVRMIVCDLSASPSIDLAGSRMLHELYAEAACPWRHPADCRGTWTGTGLA